MPNAKKIMKDIYFAKDAYDCVKDADCICLITEWKEFAELDFSRVLKLVKHPVLIDGRNFYSPEKMRSLGFIYKSVGRP
jgi:UDPglucose 6-dehydrogenase